MSIDAWIEKIDFGEQREFRILVSSSRKKNGKNILIRSVSHTFRSFTNPIKISGFIFSLFLTFNTRS